MRSVSEIHSVQIEDVVYHALAGKYPAAEGRFREITIRPLIGRLRNLPLDEIPDGGVVIKDVEQDVLNQVTTLIRLERDWAARPIADVDLQTIHRALCGSGSWSPGLRTTEFVEDFGGEPPTRALVIWKNAGIRSTIHCEALMSCD